MARFFYVYQFQLISKLIHSSSTVVILLFSIYDLHDYQINKADYDQQRNHSLSY